MKNKYINYLKKKMAFFGIILGILITLMYTISPTMQLLSIGLACSIGCVLYLVIDKKNTSKKEDSANNFEKRFLDIVYVILFTLSIFLWHNSLDRPLSYFLVFSLCSGVLAISIYFSNNKLDYYIQCIKIFLLSFNIKYSIFLSSGYLPGVDSYIHAKMNELLANSGNINVLIGKEMYFPIMHIQTAIMQIITETSIKDANNFAVIIPFVFISIFVYMVGKKLFGDREGLLAMLLLSVSDFHIYWGSAPQTTSYGIMLYYSLIYVLFKNHSYNNRTVWNILSFYLIIIIIITHAVSSYILLITLFALFLASLMYGSVCKTTKLQYLGLSIITTLSLLQQWFIAIYSKNMPFFDSVVSFLYVALKTYAGFLNRPEKVVSTAGIIPPFIDRFLDAIGLSSYLLFTILGSLIAISVRCKYKDQIKFSYVIVLIILFGITFGFPLFGLRNIMPTRWFAFEYFFVSIFAAFGIINILKKINKIYLKKTFLISIVCILTFFMSSNTTSNVDSPLWLKDNTISTTYTLAEITGAVTMAQFSEHIFSDNRYGSSVLGIFLNLTHEPLQNHETIFKRDDDIFLWRNYMLDRPVRTFTKIEGYNRRITKFEILGKNVKLKLDVETNRIYDNNEIIGYYIIPKNNI
ncbi:hypothetical protein [Methanococcus maripaludis]|uniref:4-amino-4-deoxy-L-arabinose transferase-like glycosyltransferase n=1 Tax=Methanococcus maripaludis TaxID=39152 RepID=A0A7J9PU13_METMI|nr:hypothetical protein [Methanococcus maripaludis]MBA2869077.1 4-amino-4-deoxy-L-arabinose transferase-like glycosyltransferase [Methanococcus maripaludis]